MSITLWENGLFVLQIGSEAQNPEHGSVIYETVLGINGYPKIPTLDISKSYAIAIEENQNQQSVIRVLVLP